jgi:antitoxin MazE
MEAIMQVSKWGNSLAVRLPKALVEKMGLAPGDQVEIEPAGSRTIGLRKIDPRAEFLERLRAFRRPIAEGYKFDREEANER